MSDVVFVITGSFLQIIFIDKSMAIANFFKDQYPLNPLI